MNTNKMTRDRLIARGFTASVTAYGSRVALPGGYARVEVTPKGYRGHVTVDGDRVLFQGLSLPGLVAFLRNF